MSTRRCPHCGNELTPIALGPDTAPWLCAGCHRGYFNAELTSEARARYRPAARDYGTGKGKVAIRQAVELEVQAARLRGTSALPEHLPFLTVPNLRGVANLRGVQPDMAKAITAELTRRGES